MAELNSDTLLGSEAEDRLGTNENLAKADGGTWETGLGAAVTKKWYGSSKYFNYRQPVYSKQTGWISLACKHSFIIT